jgi:hypothetical protein
MNHPAGTARGGTAITVKNSIKHHQLINYSQDLLQATSVSVEDSVGLLTISAGCGIHGILYLRLESLTALAVSEARSRTPTMGFVTVPTSPLPKPEMKPYKKSCETVWFIIVSLCWILSITCSTLCMHNVFRWYWAVSQSRSCGLSGSHQALL